MNHVVAGLVAFLVATGGTVVVMQGGPLASAEADAPGPRFGSLPAVAPPSVVSAEAASAGVAAPAWREGYAWTVVYSTDFECALVVVDASAQGYRQGYACDGAEYLAAEVATRDYLFVGDFTRSLAGTEAGSTFEFFSWPLHDGKTWKTSLGGTSFEVRATFVDDVEGPFGEEPGFELEAVPAGGDEPTMVYNYVPSIAWWGRFEFPMSGFHFNVVGFASDFRGEALSGEVTGSVALGGVAGVSAFLGVDDGDDLVTLLGFARGFATGFGFGVPYYQRAELVDPNGNTALTSQGFSSTGGALYGYGVTDARPGQWELRLAGTNLGESRYVAAAIQLHTWRV